MVLDVRTVDAWGTEAEEEGARRNLTSIASVPHLFSSTQRCLAARADLRCILLWFQTPKNWIIGPETPCAWPCLTFVLMHVAVPTFVNTHHTYSSIKTIKNS